MTELGCKAPIVAMTASVNMRDIDSFKKSGMVDWLGKPFTAKELWTLLLKHLNPVSWQEIKPISEVNPEVKLENLEHIDLQTGFELANKDAELYRSIQEKFVKNASAEVEEISSKQSDGDMQAAHRAAHTFKNQAALVGASKLKELALEAELALKEGKLATEEQLAALREELAAVIEELDSALAASVVGAPPRGRPDATGGPVVGAPTGERPYNAAELKALLRPLLENGDSESKQYLDQIREVWGSEELCDLIADYDFAEALRVLDATPISTPDNHTQTQTGS
jgi:HPt (histidine-containing phosphotransfer) domain-containing protein